MPNTLQDMDGNYIVWILFWSHLLLMHNVVEDSVVLTQPYLWNERFWDGYTLDSLFNILQMLIPQQDFSFPCRACCCCVNYPFTQLR